MTLSQANQSGYMCLVLHCHLPFVRHPEHPQFLEEQWLFEAITETYLPLLEVCQRLVKDGLPLNVTLSLSPPLLEMLTDGLLQKRCAKYVRDRLDLMEKELIRQEKTDFEPAARMYLERFQHIHDTYEDRPGELFVGGLRDLWDDGHVEVITSSATHALLPFLETREGVYAQVEQGCRCCERHFGRRPRGLWLPECAWENGLDRVLADAGIKYCFLESHGVLLADPRPVYGVFAPIVTPCGLLAFGRDVESSKQVWSADEGYPGDFQYREFHRDIGYDAPYEHIKPYLDPWGDRHGLGVKYHRVTGDVPLDEKEAYDPVIAHKKAEEHAQHFIEERCNQVKDVWQEIGRSPIITAPYDAELFGHWWYEGPHFLESLWRKMASESTLESVTPPQYLAGNPVQQRARPATSTWGYEGYFEVWLNGDNDWMYPEVQRAETEMVALAREHASSTGVLARALNQCARELLLAQSSDWAFLISTKGAPEYAQKRFETHLRRFQDLNDQIWKSSIDTENLEVIERRDNIFPEIDYQLFSQRLGKGVNC